MQDTYTIIFQDGTTTTYMVVNGQGYTEKGLWDSITTYNPYDVVYSDNGVFASKTINTNSEPTISNTTNWDCWVDISAILGQQKVLIKAQGNIAKGDCLQYVSSLGDRLICKKAVGSEIKIQSKLFMGIAAEDILNNQTGYLRTFGLERNINTSMYTLGDVLYFDYATSTLSLTRPTDESAYLINVLAVTNVGIGNGSVFVRPTWENIVDSVFSKTSTNPIRNSILTNAINSLNLTASIPLVAGLYYTLTTAIAAVPSALRKVGFEITFESSAGVWETYQFKGVIANWSILGSWSNDLSLKIDKTSITDEMGKDKTKVMSQYGVCDAIMKTHEYDRNYYAYGVRLDLNGTGQSLERVGNLSLHKTLPIQSKMRGCLLNANGTVNYYLSADSDLFKEDGVTQSVLDGTDGDVMVEIPAFYCLEENILNYSYSWISEFPLPDFKYIPKTYVARYEASVNRASGQVRSIINNTTTYRGGNNTSAWDGTYRSLLGRPVTSIPRSTFRTGARNGRDVNWNILTTFNEFIVELLFKIEYATYNSQATYNSALTIEGYRQGGLGVGVTNLNSALWGTFNSYNPFIPCGYSAALGNNTGFVNYTMPVEYGTLTVQVNRYRGIENPFGHIWKIRDGFIIEMSENYTQSKYYIYDNPAHYADTKIANARLFCSIPVVEGYVKIKNKYTTMPISVGGSSLAWGYDYFYTRGEAGGLLRGVFVGGYASHGATAGLGYSAAYNSPTNADTGIGARLGYNPEIINL